MLILKSKTRLKLYCWYGYQHWFNSDYKTNLTMIEPNMKEKHNRWSCNWRGTTSWQVKAQNTIKTQWHNQPSISDGCFLVPNQSDINEGVQNETKMICLEKGKACKWESMIYMWLVQQIIVFFMSWKFVKIFVTCKKKLTLFIRKDF